MKLSLTISLIASALVVGSSSLAAEANLLKCNANNDHADVTFTIPVHTEGETKISNGTIVETRGILGKKMRVTRTIDIAKAGKLIVTLDAATASTVGLVSAVVELNYRKGLNNSDFLVRQLKSGKFADSNIAGSCRWL